MEQLKLRAVYMRGGTSKAVMFRAEDLPSQRALWDPIFIALMGSPDPNGRQLDGMGGGISSLSKVCVIGPPSRDDADVDYTFAQISVKNAAVDYSGNCGNMSSAVGPFAVDERIVEAREGEAVVRIHNTSTCKIIVARFAVHDGLAEIEGDFALPGVAGTGAPIRLDFLDPGGAGTGSLLPTGHVADTLETDGKTFRASMVDAANPCVFVDAADLHMTGIEMPEEIEADAHLLDRLEAIRIAASIRMGIARDREEAAAKPSIPKVAMVTGPRHARTLSGAPLDSDAADLTVRMISLEQPHRAVPLTGAMCLAVAARLPGSIVHDLARPAESADAPVRIAQPSGLTVVGASVKRKGDNWAVEHATVYRTARRLMEGLVCVRVSALPANLAKTFR
jgi:2-methylaconitate cis-trans-isomerase PrpF